MNWTRTSTLITGLGLIVVTNAVALLGVSYNRGGEPDSQLVLTQRELTLPHRWGWEKENNGLSLSLSYRLPGERDFDIGFYPNRPQHFGDLTWLNRDKLVALGFDVTQAPDTAAGRRYYERLLPKDVMLVLELDGPAYQQRLQAAQDKLQQEETLVTQNPGAKEFVERATAARQALQAEENTRSRLFVVDAGLDATTLRNQYPDRTRYALVHGRVRPWLDRRDDKPLVVGHVQSLSITQINIPLEHHAPFETTSTDTTADSGRAEKHYRVTLAIGRRFEPWVVNVEQ